jgi:ABC-2 type transport system permease protein
MDRLRWAFSDVRVLTWRTLARIATTPEQLLNVTVLPLVFVLLFSYVFGGAIILPGHDSYRDYLIAGIFAVNMGGTAQGAAIGLAVDLSTGLIDRFRSLPMSRATVIVGRTVADLITTLVTPVSLTSSSPWCSRCSSLTPPRGPGPASAYSPGDRNRLRPWG